MTTGTKERDNSTCKALFCSKGLRNYVNYSLSQQFKQVCKITLPERPKDLNQAN